jgi:hypothetical protein
MGGLWSDALGERGDARLTGIEHRCDEFLTATVEPQETYFPLRAVDAGTVQRLSSTIQRTAWRPTRVTAAVSTRVRRNCLARWMH